MTRGRNPFTNTEGSTFPLLLFFCFEIIVHRGGSWDTCPYPLPASGFVSENIRHSTSNSSPIVCRSPKPQQESLHTLAYHSKSVIDFQVLPESNQSTQSKMSDMEEDEDYGFEYETDDEEEQDVDIENAVSSSNQSIQIHSSLLIESIS